jgi:hypothetical protein
VIYRKLPASQMKNGVRRVTALDIRRAIKEIIEPEEEEEWPGPVDIRLPSKKRS